MIRQTLPTVAGAAPELSAVKDKRTGFPFHPQEEIKRKPEADGSKLGEAARAVNKQKETIVKWNLLQEYLPFDS